MSNAVTKLKTVWLGIGIGTVLSIGSGFVYLALLREPGDAFYRFAGLAFVAGPLVGGTVAALRTQDHKARAFFGASSIVFGIAWMLFFVTYVVQPQFERKSVQLPAFCDGLDGSVDLPSALAYAVPRVGAGLLVAGDAQSAVVAVIEDQRPFPTTVLLVRKSEGKIVQRMRFDNDVVIATIEDGTLYIYNDKLGYLVDARTGFSEQNFLLIDNYGGLSESDRPIISRASSGHWYLETTAVISSWNIDGTVNSRRPLTFNGIARGCFVAGDTGEVTPLDIR